MTAEASQWREGLLQAVQKQLDRLWSWNARLKAMKPAGVTAVASEVPIATIACLVKALNWPHRELPLCLMVGFDIVGDIPPTGVYPKAVASEEPTPIDSLDHTKDNLAVTDRLKSAGRRANPAATQRLEELMAVSRKAVVKGYASFATKQDLDREFGAGQWRLIERFGVDQDDALRACDNAKLGRQRVLPRWRQATL